MEIILFVYRDQLNGVLLNELLSKPGTEAGRYMTINNVAHPVAEKFLNFIAKMVTR